MQAGRVRVSRRASRAVAPRNHDLPILDSFVSPRSNLATLWAAMIAAPASGRGGPPGGGSRHLWPRAARPALALALRKGSGTHRHAQRVKLPLPALPLDAAARCRPQHSAASLCAAANCGYSTTIQRNRCSMQQVHTIRCQGSGHAAVPSRARQHCPRRTRPPYGTRRSLLPLRPQQLLQGGRKHLVDQRQRLLCRARWGGVAAWAGQPGAGAGPHGHTGRLAGAVG